MPASRILSLVLILTGLGPAQLAGTYTVNPVLPASAANFTSLGAAVAALGAQGVSATVVFEVYDDAGPFLESAPFYSTTIPGLSSNLNIGDGLAAVVFSQWTGVSAANSVTFRAAPGESPVIDAAGHACVIYWNGADDTTIEGLELKGASNDAVCMYTTGTQNAIRNRITRCRIHHCGRVGVLTYGNSGAVNDTLISNNLFHDLMSNPNGGGFSGFIRDGYVAGRRDNNTRIVHNTFICNTMVQSNGWILGNYPGSTIYTAFTEVRGNVFVKSAPAGFVFRYQTVLTTTTCTASAPTLPAASDNNCFWNTGGGVFAQVGAVPSTTCPAYAPANYADLPVWQAGAARDLASVSADPLLGGPGTIAHHLLPGSPCIGLAGIVSGVAVDIDGELRDAAPDAGADESAGAALPSVTSIGAGCPGTGGLVPLLGSTQLPFLGNLSFVVDVGSAAASAPVFLFWSNGLSPVPYGIGGSCLGYLETTSLLALWASGLNPLLSGTTGPTGGFGFLIPVPNLPGLAGVHVGLQAVIGDAASPPGFTATNALDCLIN